ncbi:MAG: hypothetical protein HN368_05250 [Spirochaetales bacterium]|nr:hypothetical protein [Spirochaetales bacterium]
MLDRYIDSHPLSNWGQFRWFEFLISIWWLYEKTNESWLLDLAIKLQAQGFNWQAFFRYWPLKEPTEKNRWNYAGHVVNNAMALKEGALWWRFTGDDGERDIPYDMMEELDRHHGVPTGVFTGDECLAGTSVIQGTELCAVVEYMYSLEWLVGTFGDPEFADRLEFITFNALPATFSPDMWAHQYDQQVNQIECSIHENRNWNTNGPDSNIFGLEPNYGCCTANLSQGWPKFANHLWMRTQDNGIAAVAYAPSRLETIIDGVSVSIELETDYPFRQDLKFIVKVDTPVRFPLLLRIPAWAAEPTIATDGTRSPVLNTGTFHTIERTWKDETIFVLTLPMVPRVIPRPNSAVSISRGPLLYALAIGEDWRQINKDKPHREVPHGDWEIYPTTPWNYALEINEQTAAKDITFDDHPVADMPFTPENPPISASIKGRRVPVWKEENGSAAPTPNSPVKTNEQLDNLTLIPYGCTNLRIAEFPIARED